MKKIGILFGQENTFPPAFVERVNSKKESGITAELLKLIKLFKANQAVTMSLLTASHKMFRSTAVS